MTIRWRDRALTASNVQFARTAFIIALHKSPEQIDRTAPGTENCFRLRSASTENNMSAFFASTDMSGVERSLGLSRALVWPAGALKGSKAEAQPVSKISFENLQLPPSWYRLTVWTSEKESILAARARLVEDRRAELRIRMEAAGRKCFRKTFKIAEPLSSLSIALEGEPGYSAIRRVEIRPLNKLAIAWFLGIKAVRFAAANKGRFSWKTSWTHLRAALHPRANFAFRGRYDQQGNKSYERWRLVHEHGDNGIAAAAALNERLGADRLRILLLIAAHLDPVTTLAEIEKSLLGAAVELVIADKRALAGSPFAPSDGAFVLPIDYSGIFPRGGIERLALKLAENETLAAIFADSDVLAPDGTRRAPRLKPPWDLELLRCNNYIRAPLMIRWSPELAHALDLPGADRKPGYALALALLARHPRQNLGRIAAILFHECDPDASDLETERQILAANLTDQDRGDKLTVTENGIFRVDWQLPQPSPRVSIIIPSKDNAATLKTCIDSILDYTDTLRYEIILADNGSSLESTKNYLRSLKDPRIKLVTLPGPFNFSKINNDARKSATGDVLVFLNDDTKVISRDWLVEMVSLASRPDIGAVGAMLLYPDGSVQHGGVLLGVGGPADHAFRFMPGESGGYLDLLRCRREVSAVTGACLAISAAHFDSVGGFDEKLMVTCNDVDLCLRLRAAGLSNIWTPWSRLEHWESMSRGVDYTEQALARQAEELRIMSERWGDLLDRDPTYHPGLSDFAPNFSLSI